MTRKNNNVYIAYNQIIKFAAIICVYLNSGIFAHFSVKGSAVCDLRAIVKNHVALKFKCFFSNAVSSTNKLKIEINE